MKYRYIVFKAFFVLIVLLAACSQTQPPEISSLASSHMRAFGDTGKLTAPQAFNSAVYKSMLGKTSITAAVPLFFNNDGRLLTKNQLGVLIKAKQSGDLNRLKSATAVDDYFRQRGIYYRYIDLVTYRSVMNRLSQSGAIRLADYRGLSGSATTVQSMPDRTTKYHIWNPYVYVPSSTQPQPTAIGVTAQLKAGCEAQKSLTLQQASLSLSTQYMLTRLVDKQSISLQPLQSCTSTCAFAATACTASCGALIEVPILAGLCVVTCGAIYTACLLTC